MTNDDINRMAEEVGFDLSKPNRIIVRHSNGSWVSIKFELERFARLVAAAEREACAKVCEEIHAEYDGEDVLATWCAQAIRARGQQ